MTSTECCDLIKRGIDIEVPGLDVYYDKIVSELRGVWVFNFGYEITIEDDCKSIRARFSIS